MRRRSLRVLVLLVTVAVTAAAVWRATTTEQARGRARLADQQVDARAADAVHALADLRAALHAYVAPGQGLAFWSARADEQLARIRTLIAGLDEAAAAVRFPLTAAHEALERLAASERRARANVEDGQLLLAGDVIFTQSIRAEAQQTVGHRRHSRFFPGVIARPSGKIHRHIKHGQIAVGDKKNLGAGGRLPLFNGQYGERLLRDTQQCRDSNRS